MRDRGWIGGDRINRRRVRDGDRWERRPARSHGNDHAGVPAAAILKAMTTNAAALFRMKDVRGAIAKGLAADIIATPENPLQNIQALKKVAFVMKAGTVIKQPTR